jgi:hypothetical protein
LLPLSSLRSNAIIDDGNMYLFATEDPQFYFGLDESEVREIDEVVVTCNPLAFGSEALQRIIEVQKNQPLKQQRPFSLLHWFKTRS